MTKFAIKGLLSRKLRTALTAIAIVLGVAMISGTFVLTDSIDQAFDKIFTDIRQGSNAVITGKSAFDLCDRTASATPTFDESLLAAGAGAARRRRGRGQRRQRRDTAHRRRRQSDRVRAGRPNLGFSIANGDSAFNPLTLVDGRLARAERGRRRQGDCRRRRTSRSARRSASRRRARSRSCAISGIVQFSSGLTIGGATLAGLRPPDRAAPVQARTGSSTRSRSPRSRTSRDTAARRRDPPRSSRRRRRCGRASSRRESDASGHERASSPSCAGSCSRSAASRCSSGSFVIANSLSITIAQRTREFATLRTLGASRRQILRLDHRRGARRRHRSRRSSACSSGSLLAKGLFWLFDVVGFIASEHRARVPHAHVRDRALARRNPRDADREPAPGDPRDPRPTDRGRARGRGSPAAEAPARCAASAPRSWPSPGFAAIAYGIFAQRPRDEAGPDLDGRRNAAHVHRRLALLVAARPSARGVLGWPGDADRRRGRACSRATTRAATRSGPRRRQRR